MAQGVNARGKGLPSGGAAPHGCGCWRISARSDDDTVVPDVRRSRDGSGPKGGVYTALVFSRLFRLDIYLVFVLIHSDSVKSIVIFD